MSVLHRAKQAGLSRRIVRVFLEDGHRCYCGDDDDDDDNDDDFRGQAVLTCKQNTHVHCFRH